MAAKYTVDCIEVAANNTEIVKSCLREKDLLNDVYKIKRMDDNKVVIPVHDTIHKYQSTIINSSISYNIISVPEQSLKKKSKFFNSKTELHRSVTEFYEQRMGHSLPSNLTSEIPTKWIRHNDLILLPAHAFLAKDWHQLGNGLWRIICSVLGIRRLAKCATIQPDNYRTPRVEMLIGYDGWVTHLDNGIKYCFDVCKCMFSSGNISEKLRISTFDCRNEVVVDLYAGIGYFVLPFLVHAKAKLVHACEWNQYAVEALEKSLIANNVRNKCVIHFGDNRQHAPRYVADRVNLGLLPTSRPGWHVACAALKSDRGGWLHVHCNVNTFGIASSERKQSWLKWGNDVASEMQSNLNQLHDGKIRWKAACKNVAHVKCYAPHIDHLVADVHCTPST